MTTSIITRILRKLFSVKNNPDNLPNSEQLFVAPEKREPPKPSNIPAEMVGYHKHESRQNPGQYYYKNLLPEPLPDLPQIRANGFFSYQVRSAFHYQPALELITWGRREAPIIFRTNCILRAEPENTHDRHAIAVLIGDTCCGHIARGDNRKLANELRAAGIIGDVQCHAEITAGPFYTAGPFRMNLDLAFPFSIRPSRPISKPRARKQRAAARPSLSEAICPILGEAETKHDRQN